MLRRAGYELRKFDAFHAPLARRAALMTTGGINLVLDVGANAGQYATELRRVGYKGRIVSFEPLSAPREQLLSLCEHDRNWTVVAGALGTANGRATMNVAGDDQCSSMLDMRPALTDRAPEVQFVGTEEVDMFTLDSLFPDLVTDGDRVLLKLDVQGYERSVLEGAGVSLPRIQAAQLELSLVSLYDGEALFHEMLEIMRGHGFTLMSVEPTMVDQTGQMLQIDGYFGRASEG